ncbi:M56 family metallopeptidase [Kordiimonas laminariae]|uniref:M56 family metallopeptidase n=1 Tax=Kordiimonas laminariae TaxID=2917717 RepID=UPI001FF13F07|nr:M56 family metallopeptidase [Kordiimonas laminariae]MCK0068684.1 M48 family metalloprotease [Kordiimonas laminariae]
MLDFFMDFPLFDLLVKFMIASSTLLLLVWVMEKIRLINTPDLAERAWKAAIAGSFIAVLPFTNLISPEVVINDRNMVEIAGDIAERRPLLEISTKQSSGIGALEEKQTAQEKLDATILEEQRNLFPAPTKPIQDTLPIREAAPEETRTSFYELRTIDLAVVTWIVLGLLAVTGLLLGYRSAIHNLGSRVRVGAEENANLVLREICEEADIKHVPYLSKSSDINSPVCLPKREICLPDWAFETMPRDEFKSLLAHEIGHMLRKDPQMLIALQLLTRFFFFQPLFLLARKRLTDIAELAADEWAASRIQSSRSVANALYTCATKIHETRHIEWGLAMAGNKSILRHRVERLLKAEDTPFKTSAKSAKALVSVGVIGLSLGIPSIQFAGAGNSEFNAFEPLEPDFTNIRNEAEPNLGELKTFEIKAPEVAVATANAGDISAISLEGGKRGITFDRKRDSGNMNWHDGKDRINVQWKKGFSIDHKDNTISVVNGGQFTLKSEDKNGDERKIRIKNVGGDRSVTYWVDGDKTKFDAKGQKWLNASLEKLYSYGFEAKERIKYLVKAKGAKAVIKEINGFETDYVRRLYISGLAATAKLKSGEVSDLIKATSKIESDYEMRLAFSGLLRSENNIPSSMLPKIIKAAKAIDSDYEKRLLADTFIKRFDMDDKNIRNLIDLASDIDSDYELRLMLAQVLDSQTVNKDNIEKLIEVAAKQIDSDYEMRLLLSEALKNGSLTSKGINLTLEAAFETMDSDYEKRLLLSTLIQHNKLGVNDWLKVIEAAALIDSDYEKRLILSKIKRQMPSSRQLSEAMEEAIDTIGSDHERRLVAGKADKERAVRAARAANNEWRTQLRELRDVQRQLVREQREVEREMNRVMKEAERLKKELDKGQLNRSKNEKELEKFLAEQEEKFLEYDRLLNEQSGLRDHIGNLAGALAELEVSMNQIQLSKKPVQAPRPAVQPRSSVRPSPAPRTPETNTN